jgi:hypothetical protein
MPATRIVRHALALLTVLVPASLSALPSSMETPHLRVVIRTASPADRELLSRVRGQASDLDVEIIDAPTDSLEGAVGEQLRASAAIADVHAATVVFWFSFERSASTLLVFVAEPKAGRLFVRSIEGQTSPPTASATRPSSFALEAAALVVRTALQAFAAGGTIGIHWRAVDSAPPPPPHPLTGGAAPTVTPVPGKRKLGWFASVGWQVAFDGYSPYGQMGIAADAGLSVGRLEVALALSMAPLTTLRDELVSVELSRYAVAAAAGWRLVWTRSFGLVAGAQLGYAAFYRATTTTAPSLSATPPQVTSSSLLGAQLRASWRPRGGRLTISADVGCDYVAGAPSLIYSTGAGPQRERPLWLVQPRVGVALGFILP